MKDHEKFREVKKKYDKHFSEKPENKNYAKKEKSKKLKKVKKK